MVATGFERHVDCRAPCALTGGAQRVDLGVCFARFLMPTFADNLAVFDDDAADARIRGGGIQPALGKA